MNSTSGTGVLPADGASKHFPFTKRDFVNVQSRTWPGINKPGGVGRVTKVNVETGTVNVKYVLGGSEKNVELKYCSPMVTASSRTPRKRKASSLSPGASKIMKMTSRTARLDKPPLNNTTSEATADLTSSTTTVPTSPTLEEPTIDEALQPGSPHQPSPAPQMKSPPATQPSILTNASQAVTPGRAGYSTANTNAGTKGSQVPVTTAGGAERKEARAFPFSVREFVNVQSRTWPGINKPGGVGRITRINVDTDTVNIKYVLGGSEKNVPVKYVKHRIIANQLEEKRDRISTDFFHNNRYSPKNTRGNSRSGETEKASKPSQLSVGGGEGAPSSQRVSPGPAEAVLEPAKASDKAKVSETATIATKKKKKKAANKKRTLLPTRAAASASRPTNPSVQSSQVRPALATQTKKKQKKKGIRRKNPQAPACTAGSTLAASVTTSASRSPAKRHSKTNSPNKDDPIILPPKKNRRIFSGLDHLSRTASSPLGKYVTERVCQDHVAGVPSSFLFSPGGGASSSSPPGDEDTKLKVLAKLHCMRIKLVKDKIVDIFSKLRTDVLSFCTLESELSDVVEREFTKEELSSILVTLECENRIMFVKEENGGSIYQI